MTLVSFRLVFLAGDSEIGLMWLLRHFSLNWRAKLNRFQIRCRLKQNKPIYSIRGQFQLKYSGYVTVILILHLMIFIFLWKPMLTNKAINSIKLINEKSNRQIDYTWQNLTLHYTIPLWINQSTSLPDFPKVKCHCTQDKDEPWHEVTSSVRNYEQIQF